MRKLLLAIVVLLFHADLFAQQLPLGGPNLEGPPQRPLRTGIQIRDDMKPGEVLARGNRVDLNRDGVIQDNECYFDYGITLQFGQSVDTRVGPGCTVLLDKVTQVAARILSPSDAPSLVRRLFDRLRDAVLPTAYAQSYPYRAGIYGHLYMWGGGGKDWDGLTAQQGWYEYEWNQSQARSLHAGGWYCDCGNVHPPQGCLPLLGIPPMNGKNAGWQPLQMGWKDWFPGPGTYTGRLDWSEFWFNPGHWRHTLFVRRVGRPNWNSTPYGECPMWLEGSYIAGTTQYCGWYNLPWPHGYRP